MAVVREGDAVVIIEGTALYAFDVLREPGLHKYRAKVTGDLAKAAALAPHADAYALVLCTHILGEIASQLLCRCARLKLLTYGNRQLPRLGEAGPSAAWAVW